jgi:hypothetical protein
MGISAMSVDNLLPSSNIITIIDRIRMSRESGLFHIWSEHLFLTMTNE